jgi:hypothetical protein
VSDPLRELFPVFERDPPPPARPRACPRCRRSLHFTHYDAEKYTAGDMFQATRFYGAELAPLLLLCVIAATVGWLAGTLAAVLAMLLAAPLLLGWSRRSLAARAVWFCPPCDAYYVGPRLRPWRTREAPQRLRPPA